MQNEVVENLFRAYLFRAYLIDAQDVGDTEVLKSIGTESGLDVGRLEEVAAAGLGTEELMAEESEARARGVTGVPTFIVSAEPRASGAQKPELLAAIPGPALGAAERSVRHSQTWPPTSPDLLRRMTRPALISFCPWPQFYT